MQTVKRFLSGVLALLMTVGALCFCTSAAETYPEEFYWDKAGEDADNGYKAYMVEYGAALFVPDDPAREGCVFLGWKDWNTDAFVDLTQETMNAKGRRFYAAWQRKTVPSYFYVFGTLWCTIDNVPGEAFIHPRTPQQDGYTFSGWTPKIPAAAPAEALTFHAVFTPNTYIATLLVDGKVYKEIEYTYGQKSIALPDVPKKPGYTGTWAPYTLPVGGVTIPAVYTPNTYIATLLVDGKVYKEIEYTYGQKSIALPDVPEKPGYTGTWAPYSLPVGGVTVRAMYKAADIKAKTIAGDADGDSEITLRDAAVMTRSLAGGWNVEVCAANMDVNADGEVNLKDVVLVRRYLADGWNVHLY